MSPKDEAENLLDALLPLAKQLLAQHGELYPFGGTLGTDGTVSLVSPDIGNDHPSSQQVIDALPADFRAGSYRAVGIAYAITTVPPGRTEPTDAIVIRLDNVSGYSVQVPVPARPAGGPDSRIAVRRARSRRRVSAARPRVVRLRSGRNRAMARSEVGPLGAAAWPSRAPGRLPALREAR
jgi:hypothetical protein